MDSQLTLVGARSPTPSGENIILVFDRDDMGDTTLRICGTGLPSYFVYTLDNTTTVFTGDYLLATVTRRKFRPDQIAFPASAPMSLRSWLKAPILWSFPLEFCACGRRFEWRQDRSGQLVLRESGRPSDALAWFSRSRRDLGDNLHAAYLAIKPEIVEMRDTIVLSCLLAEHKLRVITAARGKTILDTMILGF